MAICPTKGYRAGGVGATAGRHIEAGASVMHAALRQRRWVFVAAPSALRCRPCRLSIRLVRNWSRKPSLEIPGQTRVGKAWAQLSALRDDGMLMSKWGFVSPRELCAQTRSPSSRNLFLASGTLGQSAPGSLYLPPPGGGKVRRQKKCRVSSGSCQRLWPRALSTPSPPHSWFTSFGGQGILPRMAAPQRPHGLGCYGTPEVSALTTGAGGCRHCRTLTCFLCLRSEGGRRPRDLQLSGQSPGAPEKATQSTDCLHRPSAGAAGA